MLVDGGDGPSRGIVNDVGWGSLKEDMLEGYL
jgi:hypothetical protein